jgi:hypothetical protein
MVGEEFLEKGVGISGDISADIVEASQYRMSAPGQSGEASSP